MEALGYQLVQLAMILAQITGRDSTPNEIQEVCQWQSFKASCGPGQVIRMRRARYGRMRLGQCVTEDMGHLGCQNDVIEIMDSKCSGRRECAISVPDPDLDSSKPCSELQNYLEASYDCLDVETIEGSICRSCDFIRPKRTSGYIAKVVTEETGCGSTDCPWLLAGAQGQKIRISLLDYGITQAHSTIRIEHPIPNVCKVYAVLKEDSTRKSVTVCGGVKKEREIFISQTHAVEVRILGNSQPEDREFYLLRYEIIGCPYLSPPEGATFHRTDTEATISCTTSTQSWTLKCNGTRWVGSYSNCTNSVATTSKHQAASIPYGMSVAIVVGVAFVIGSIIVVAGLACYKLRRTSAHRGLRRVPPPPEDIYQHPRAYPHGDEIHLTYTVGIRECKENLQNCGTLGRQKMCCEGARNDYAHIWEGPLPAPKQL